VRKQKIQSENRRLQIKKSVFVIFKFQFLFQILLSVLPATATTSEPVLSVVQSQENANQWLGITNRLQALGVKYCVVSLNNVKSAADWGERTVLFLPNVELLTPAQVISLEEWMRKGGRLIVSGPAGNLSAPGVRQLLRNLVGGYWGFSLNGSQQLQPAKVRAQGWANENNLFGKVRGGVVISDDLNTQAAAVWNSKDNPTAVVANERSIFFGWRWGVDAASPAKLDTAWLQAALNRYLKKPSAMPKKVEGGSQTCSTAVAMKPPGTRKVGGAPSTAVSRASSIATAPQSRQVPKATPQAPHPRQVSKATPQSSDEAIDLLEQAVRLDVAPNSQASISAKEAIALQQELENLIGRVESAHLAARLYSKEIGETNLNNLQSVKAQTTEVASTSPEVPVSNLEQVLAQAQKIAKNLPQLVASKKYAEARQQWLMAKASLWNQFPINRRLAQPEIRAMWLDRGTIVRARNQRGLALIFDRMAQAGINTVFFETVNAGYTIYPSKIAPQQNPLIQGWDPLDAAVKLAHERGMELHAWVWTFAVGNRRHNEILNIDPNYPGPVLGSNPDWAGYDNRGQMIPVGQTKPFLDPANPQARQYLLSLYEEIVTQYNVDGLQLDYIRYPFQDPSANRTYGYGKVARAQFQQLTGVDPLHISPGKRDIWQKWTEFRTSTVDSFVAQVSHQLRQKRPNLILSVAVFPLPESERIQKIQQRWEVWAKRGDIDLIVPMTYALDTLRFSRLAQPWISSRQLGAALLVPGIRLKQLPTLAAFDQIQLVRDLPTIGYALFAAENFSADLHKVFQNTQGNIRARQKDPIPQRQPFQTAAARYVALQREWNFVFQDNQKQLPAITLSEFNAQAEIVQSALNQLAAEPSSSKLLAAKASLLRFQFQFRKWMRSSSLENSYQVKVWENRLNIIERLLLYGERAELRNF
jgi:uncharacterized lipoprotein YddW (UPF0748 family)